MAKFIIKSKQTAILSIVGIIVLVVVMFFYNKYYAFTSTYQGVSQNWGEEIIKVFTENGIDYKISEDGTAILIRKRDKAKAGNSLQKNEWLKEKAKEEKN